MYDLIVIGGGPAGLTATIYAIRKRLNVLMVSKDLGGKTNFKLALPWVDEYQVIRGLEVVNKFRSELEYLDFARHMDAVEKVTKDGENFSILTKSGEKLAAKAVIVATGAKQRKMEVPGEREFLSKGLCYSALSYAPLFIDKRTAVVGDGDLALRSAAELSTVAEHVHIIGPSKDAVRGPLGQKLLSSNNVTILYGFKVTEVLGNGYANRLKVQSPEGEASEIEADGTFIEMAIMPNSSFVAGLADLDELGHIIVDNLARSRLPGLFAAGDVANSYAEQVLVAVGEGAKAALSAYDYLLPRLGSE